MHVDAQLSKTLLVPFYMAFSSAFCCIMVDSHFGYWLFLSRVLRTEKVKAIIKSAKTGMISYFPLIQGSYLSVPYSWDLISMYV